MKRTVFRLNIQPRFYRLALLTLLTWVVPLSMLGATDDVFQDLQVLLVRGKYEELEKINLHELRDYPNSLRALYFLYALHDNQGDAQTARQYLLRFGNTHRKQTAGSNVDERILGIDFRFIRAYYALGSYYFEQKQYAEALEWLVMSQPLYSADPGLQYRLAFSYQRTGDFEQARVHYFLQKELEPKNPEITYNISCSFAQEANTAKALLWLKKAIRQDKKFRNLASGDASFDAIRATQEFQDFLRNNS